MHYAHTHIYIYAELYHTGIVSQLYIIIYHIIANPDDVPYGRHATPPLVLYPIISPLTRVAKQEPVTLFTFGQKTIDNRNTRKLKLSFVFCPFSFWVGYSSQSGIRRRRSSAAPPPPSPPPPPSSPRCLPSSSRRCLFVGRHSGCCSG